MESPLRFFAGITDPRVERCKRHLLDEIIFIAIASVICGAETWNDMEDFGRMKYDWLKTFLKLPGGIPTHDTFNRLFASLDPDEFEKRFLDWTSAISQRSQGDIVSIDGKAIRGSRGSGKKSIVYMVSAWAGSNKIVLGQRKVDDKSNEITAIPQLLETLVLKGCVVTIDAMGCQKEIAAAIVEKEADYILALKGNQGTLSDQVQESFRFLPVESTAQENDLGHGRVEKRTCSVVCDLSLVEHKDQWGGLKSLIKIESERYNKTTAKTEKETRYFISSLLLSAQYLNGYVRSHWGVENSLHWSLDVSFNEDLSRKRAGYAAENFSRLNRISLNLLKNDKLSKRGIKGKRLKAGWSNEYLLKILKPENL
jgi:predicted transposase YbfD/YdcC